MAVKVKGDKSRVPTDAEKASAVKHERLICCDVDDNNNKQWMGWVLQNGDGYCEWGRVNKAPQHEYYAFGDTYEAERWLERKTEDKLSYTDKAAYTRQRTIASSGPIATKASSGVVVKNDLKSIATQQIQGDSEAKKLAAWLAEVNIHQITKNTQITYNVATGAFSTPLGLVTPDGISEARDILSDISTYVARRAWEDARYKKLLSDYLRIVPQDLGMTREWHTTIFAPSDALQKQNDLLDSLTASLQPVATTKKTDSKVETVFNVRLDTVSDSSIIDRIKRKYRSEKGSHYDVQRYDVYKVWTVELNTVRTAFQSDGLKVGNIMQLWHGVKCSSLLSILKSGLIIMPASSPNVTGSMFSRGLYFSDMSSKSLRYATGAWGGSGNVSRTFMLIADVAMGKYYVPSGPTSSPPPKGYDSYFAQAGKSGVMHNEMVIFNPAQCDLTYLVEFK